MSEPTEEQIAQWAAEAEAGYDVSQMDPNSAIAVGQRRRTAMGRLFTVMKLSVMNHEALIKFDDRTTDWWEFDWIRSDSTVEP
jgi:hypothetical protein